VLSRAKDVVTPLRWRAWEEELLEHPDREWVEFLLRGVRDGFRLGHDQSDVRLERRSGTMYEATQHSTIIREYLEKEVGSPHKYRVFSCLHLG